MGVEEKKLLVVSALFESDRYSEVNSAMRTFIVPADLNATAELSYFLSVMRREILSARHYSSVEWLPNKVQLLRVDKEQMKTVIDSYDKSDYKEYEEPKIRIVRFTTTNGME